MIAATLSFSSSSSSSPLFRSLHRRFASSLSSGTRVFRSPAPPTRVSAVSTGSIRSVRFSSCVGSKGIGIGIGASRWRSPVCFRSSTQIGTESGPLLEQFQRRIATMASEHPFKGIFTSLPRPGGGEFGKFYSLPALNDPRIVSFLGGIGDNGGCIRDGRRASIGVFSCKGLATGAGDDGGESLNEDGAGNASDVAPRIKFKRLDKTARYIMQILNKEAVEEVKAQREVPDIRPGYIVQLKVEVPENKRRITTIKGIVIARKNSGISTTFRIRRLVAGVGVESLFPLYSPNIKEIKVLDKKKVRRAKLYYLRDKMNALKK